MRERGAQAKGFTIAPGDPLPLGVRDCCDGFNFAVFSRHARAVQLLLYADAAAERPDHVIALDPERHRTGDIWHVLIDGIDWGTGYAWRAAGPWSLEAGQRFDPRRILLDPCATAIVGTAVWDYARLVSAADPPRAGDAAFPDDVDPAPRGLLVNRRFDWQGDRHPRRPWPETVIYEAHVRGLTIHPSSGAAAPGTFLGVIEKIPYLVELGVTAVELMPVQEFNAREGTRADPETGRPLGNYWGYNTAAFWAPKEGYGTRAAPGCQLDEFKTMVRALHRAGIEVILDVVFNHTAEGNENGPTISFRGLDNTIYYMLGDGGRTYKDYSGCGNTLDCAHPVVRDFVIDCLRYWATEMHVDGFRFDLASILGRGEDGALLSDPPLLERIAEDPILREAKLIAEAWDSGGAYQVGSFPGQRWAEWNARFRDDVRRYWRADPGTAGALARRLCGSADLYQRGGKEPVNGVNFLTCHDGFTLNDLVSYATKHNAANGEGNRDGADENFSANCGVEGPSDDPAVEGMRLRRIKAMLATLMLSRGVPMLLGGDEFRRSQRGNNNAYCQDNEVSWVDWRLAERNRDLIRFVRGLIRFRARHKVLRADAFYREGEILWLGPDGAPPDWVGPQTSLGCLVAPETPDAGTGAGPLCLLFNPTESDVPFLLPSPPVGFAWRTAIDTSAPPPADIAEEGGEECLADQGRISVATQSVTALVCKPPS